MNTLRTYARPVFNSQVLRESSDDLSFGFDRALADELGIDKTGREWQALAASGSWWGKYRNASGQLYPFFDTEAQLDVIRAKCRVMGQVFPMAITAMEALTDYTVGTGYQFESQPIDDRVGKDFCRRCDRIIEEFINRTNWKSDRDRELFALGRCDGDMGVALFDVGDGHADVRFVEGEFITEPSSTRAIEDWLSVNDKSSWTFGVHTPAHDTERVLGYYVQWTPDPGDFDYFKAEDFELVKYNTRRKVKRGLSDYHAILAWLMRHDKLLRGTAIGATIKANISHIEEYAEGVQRADIEQISFGSSAYTYKPSPSGDTRYAEVSEPGTVVAMNKGVKYIPGPMGTERDPHFLAVAAAVARLIGARWSMPEYLISGDASNANYSSTMVAESPFVKASLARQAKYGRIQTNILYRVLNIALKAGKLRSFQVEDIGDLRHVIDVVAKAPSMEVREKKPETERRKILKDEGILSDATWAEEEGYDYEEEQKRGAKKALPPPVVAPPLKEGWAGYP